jgi:hypothetical protein
MKWIKGGNVARSCLQLIWFASRLIPENRSSSSTLNLKMVGNGNNLSQKIWIGKQFLYFIVLSPCHDY